MWKVAIVHVVHSLFRLSQSNTREQFVNSNPCGHNEKGYLVPVQRLESLPPTPWLDVCYTHTAHFT